MAQKNFMGTIGWIKSNLMISSQASEKGYSNENFYPGAPSIPDSEPTKPTDPVAPPKGAISMLEIHYNNSSIKNGILTVSHQEVDLKTPLYMKKSGTESNCTGYILRFNPSGITGSRYLSRYALNSSQNSSSADLYVLIANAGNTAKLLGTISQNKWFYVKIEDIGGKMQAELYSDEKKLLGKFSNTAYSEHYIRAWSIPAGSTWAGQIDLNHSYYW